MIDYLRRFMPGRQSHRAPASPDRGEIGTLLSSFGIHSTPEYRGRQLTPRRLQAILSAADEGAPGEQARLIQWIQEEEPLIAAHLQTRKAAVMACPWSVSSALDDDQDPTLADRAQEAQRMLAAAGMDQALRHLCDFVPTGYASAVADWLPGGAGVAGFVPVSPDRILFDLAGNPGLLDARGNEHSFAEFHRAQFVTVLNNSKPGLPCRNGLIRALVWMFLFKRSGISGWARYAERFGIPFTLAKLPPAQWENKTEKNRVLKMLSRLGKEGYAAIPAEAELEFQEAGGTGAEVQHKFAQYCDDIFAKLILGQTASSGDAGGFSKGQIQGEVRQDLLGHDATAISEPVQALLDSYASMRWGLEPGALRFAIDYEPEDDQDAKAKRYLTLTQITGRRIDDEQVSREFGVTLGEPLQPQGAPPPMTDRRTLALTDVPPSVSAVETVAFEALRRTARDAEALEAWAGPVHARIREALSDFDSDQATEDEIKTAAAALVETLPDVLNDMDTTALERNLTGAIMAGAINGAQSGPQPAKVTS